MAGIALHEHTTIGPGPWNPSNIIASSSSVFIEGKTVGLHGSDVVVHIKKGKSPSPKFGKVIATSKVFIEGKSVARIGDLCTHGEIICKSANSVFAM